MTPLTRKQVRAAILTPQEAAERLGIVRQTLYAWRSAGLVEPLVDTGIAKFTLLATSIVSRLPRRSWLAPSAAVRSAQSGADGAKSESRRRLSFRLEILFLSCPYPVLRN